MASKTVSWALATRSTLLATNTTLATSTRHEFAGISIAIPEPARTIRSVKLRVTARDAFTAATSFTGWRLGIKLGGAAFDDVDFASAAPNTGDHETLIVDRDVTAHFVTNFGGGASQTCQVGVAFQTSAVANVNCVTAELFVTYDYDTSAATHVKAIEVPIQGQHATIGTADAEIGTAGGVSNARPNQIPNLSAFCPEGGKAFLQVYLRVLATDAIATGANFNLSIKLDAGGTYDPRATVEQSLATGAPYRDIVDLLAAPYSMALNAPHALVMKSSLASTFVNISAVLVVVYTFSPAATTRELHSLRVPLDNDRGALDIAHAATVGDEDRYSCLLDIQEPGAIALLQSGVVVFDQMLASVANQIAVYNSGQAARTYAHATSTVLSGSYVYVRRCDHDSSTWALTRGANRLTVDSRISAVGQATEISGYAIVNYTADVPATGVGTGNRSCIYALASHPAPGTAGTIVAAEERLPSFPSSPWKLSGGAWVELGARFGGSATSVLQAERQPGEDSENGWYTETFISGASAELGRRELIRPITRWVRTSARRSRGMDLTTTRRWRVACSASIANVEWCGDLWVTLSDLSFPVAGAVMLGASPVPNGGAVRVYADDGAGEAEYITTVATSGGTGAFAVAALDNTRAYFAVYDVGGNKAWSGLRTPGAQSFDIVIPTAAAAYVPPPPVLTSPSSGSGRVAAAPTAGPQGLLDLAIDPITRDLIDAPDGGFVETADSRSAVIAQLESEYLAWWGSPFDGSRIREILSGDDPADAQMLSDEVLRALQPLVAEGIISEIDVDLDVDEAGRVVVLINYRDQASGGLIDLAYVPFGG